ncbi:MAG: hypothetical protein ACRD0K_21405 [Egibacteraceae bacterium]
MTPDGEQIITAGDDGTARIWNRRNGQHLRTPIGHFGLILAVAVTPTARRSSPPAATCASGTGATSTAPPSPATAGRSGR